MANTPICEDEILEIKRLAREGLSADAIAARVGRCRNTVYRYSSRLDGDQPRKIGRPGPRPWTVEKVLDVRRRRPGLSINQIAKHLGLDRDVVTRILVKHGLHPARRSRLDRGEGLQEAA